ncbi:hypothetical protein GM415_12090 [Pseudodesulfovibrio cashew]|uniref:ParB-like N-terminal domain-containing protein n=1 Tax=Pseudodesulfovibrio cashew TaxID=2678688 RepID=A0A6I6JT73_9BACT|nr:ParB/RepB/Spo0J family partition protein [Pseudodesulfovibrio cashew]QGY40834.1 hypothetical protein GM415_12090 [Pseudodesulfovibrio cashew]
MHLTNEIITASPDALKADGPYLFWSGTVDESLKKSLEEFGQTTPVLAIETDHGLELVAGYARLAVLRAAGTPVLVRLARDTDARDLGLLYLTDNMARPQDDGMRLAALRYFRPLMDDAALSAVILPRLGIKAKSKDAKLFITWLDLPESWQEHLAAGRIPLATATLLSRMAPEDRDAVEPLFSGHSWSRSNAVNMLTWLFETARMQQAPLAEVLRTAGLDAILQQGLSPKDAIARLTSAAKAARYPSLSRLQARFVEIAGELSTGTRWRLTQPNNFETGGAELSIQVKNAAQLADAVEQLQAMAGQSAWEKLWNLGGQDD